VKSVIRRLPPCIALVAAALAAGCRPAERSAPQEASPIVTPVRRYAVAWVSASIPAAMRPGERLAVPVSFRNSGDRVVQAHFAVSYHWYRSGDRRDPAVWDGVRTVIGRDVTPGETWEGPMTLQAPPGPGAYELALDVVQEGVAWLSWRGAPMSFHPVRVE
jgi:hypothetical protein